MDHVSYPMLAAPPNTPTEPLGHVLREKLKKLQIQQYRILKNENEIKAALNEEHYDLFIDLVTDCMTRQPLNMVSTNINILEVYTRASRIFSGHTQLKASFSMFLLPADRAGYNLISAAELAAQLTCFLWFETTETIRRAENWTPGSSPIEWIAQDAIPTPSFKKWVLAILSRTWVTPSVIHLALMFIYRLKTLGPALESMATSQYRLLTVALMLGNKVLDDKAYPNKTWAGVSGIPVNEIHVMEIEFLGSMGYRLLASEEKWAVWQRKLGKFGDYFEEASKLPLPPSSPLPSPKRLQSHPPISPQRRGKRIRT